MPSEPILCYKFMEHIPVVTELDVSDMITIVKSKRLLAYSMVYVAARFVPGCRAI